jgi:hypothetical protein
LHLGVEKEAGRRLLRKITGGHPGSLRIAMVVDPEKLPPLITTEKVICNGL